MWCDLWTMECIGREIEAKERRKHKQRRKKEPTHQWYQYECATTKRKGIRTSMRRQKEKKKARTEKKKKGPRKIFGTRRNCLPFPTEIVIIQYLNWYVSKGLCYIYSKLLVGLRNTNHEARDTVWYVINNFGLEFFH